MHRIVLGLGGVEVVIGGVMTAWPYLLPQWVGIILVVIGALTILYAVLPVLVPRKNEGGKIPRYGWLRMWSVGAALRDWTPFRRLISLRCAADLAYRKTRDTQLAELFEHWAREKNEGRDHVLEDYASYLVGHGEKMDVWGVRPPSDLLHKIDAEELVSGIYGDGGNSFIPTHEKRPKWERLHVLKRDLKQRIKDIQEGKE